MCVWVFLLGFSVAAVDRRIAHKESIMYFMFLSSVAGALSVYKSKSKISAIIYNLYAHSILFVIV